MALMRTSRNGEPPGKKKSSYEVSSKSGGKVDLKGVSLTEGKYTAEKANIDYEKALKSGSMVSVYDKSVDPTTRKFVLGSIGTSDNLGKRTDIAIPKGYKASSYKDVYGVDFNPEEFRAASKGPDFDKYLKQKGISAGQSFVPQFGYQSRYETEADRKKQKQIEFNELKAESMKPLSKLPLLKPEKIASKTVGSLRMSEKSEPMEKSDWDEPSKAIKKKSKTVKPYNVKAGEYIRQNIKYGIQKLTGKEPILRPGVKKEKDVSVQKREGKMAKAYFSNFEGKTYGDIAGTKEEPGIRGTLKKDKAELRAGIKTARKAGDAEKVQGYKAAKRDINAEIKQTKLAGKYLNKLGRQYTGVFEGQELENTGKIKVYTPEKMAGFMGSKQDVFNSDANFNKFLVKRSTDNAVNKNKTFGRKESNPKKKS